MMNVSVNGTHFALAGLIPFVNYSVSVAAITTDGVGVFSSIKSQISGQDSKYESKIFTYVPMLAVNYI